MRVLSMDRRGAKRARQYLAVRLGIAQYVAFAALVIVLELLPGANRSHQYVAYSCAGLALAYAGVQASVPARRSLMWLFYFGSGAYIVLASVVIAATGGATSPVRVLLIFSVVFGAWFYETRPAIWTLSAAIAATLLPLAYDGHALRGGPLGMTIVLTTVLVMGGVLTILGRVELSQMRDAARSEARRDPLTDLANRRALIRYLEKLGAGRRESDRCGLVYLDLDGFKQVNAAFGHAGGDAVLMAVAAALRSSARTSDLVARVGGDEFAIVAVGLNPAGLRRLAERAVNAVEQAMLTDFLPQAERAHVRASAGAALWPDDATDPDSLLRSADLALLAAKRAGKGCVVTADEDRAAVQASKRAEPSAAPR
jgi:diguanylate cyclase (GGDEF)-like protein